MEAGKLILLIVCTVAVSLALMTNNGVMSRNGAAYKSLFVESPDASEEMAIPVEKPSIVPVVPPKPCSAATTEDELGTTIFIYSKGDRIASMKKDAAPQLAFYHTDYLGSSRLMSDQCGNTRWESDYYPFGGALNEKTLTKENAYKFTGKEYDDEMSLYYYGARYYDPVIGRFTQVDPMVRDFGNYLYSENNPIIIRDPDGADSQFTQPVFLRATVRDGTYNLQASTPTKWGMVGASYSSINQNSNSQSGGPKVPSVLTNVNANGNSMRLNVPLPGKFSVDYTYSSMSGTIKENTMSPKPFSQESGSVGVSYDLVRKSSANGLQRVSLEGGYQHSTSQSERNTRLPPIPFQLPSTAKDRTVTGSDAASVGVSGRIGVWNRDDLNSGGTELSLAGGVTAIYQNTGYFGSTTYVSDTGEMSKPLFTSQSDHGYSTQSYLNAELSFGIPGIQKAEGFLGSTTNWADYPGHGQGSQSTSYYGGLSYRFP